MSDKIPSDWAVPDGWVLTWYPPFTFPFPVAEDHPIQVYDNGEPFVPAPGFDGYNPNTSTCSLSDFGGVHPGVYALNVAGEEPGFDPDNPLNSEALQRFGKAVKA
jgi:hypothetical protein